MAALLQGIEAMGCQVDNLALQTTPMLHWQVLAAHESGRTQGKNADYFHRVQEAYQQLLLKGVKTLEQSTVVVDCAHGVGGVHAPAVFQPFAASVKLRNTDASPGLLNNGVGSDFVQRHKRFPKGLEDVGEGERACSMDGDADRLVYFTRRHGEFALLDGDRIAVLAALYATNCIVGGDTANQSGELQMGVVQTAYANGASTRYMTHVLRLPVLCVPTGVKHLHTAAAKFDIGIYFEANGHGTVFFNQQRLANVTEGQKQGVEALLGVMNQSAGDSFSCIFLVEAALRSLGMSIFEWLDLYQDYPSTQLKVRVESTAALKTEGAMPRCVQPKGLQGAIDAEVSKYQNSRAFIRASGTEEGVVRVYSEAATPVEADELANAVGELVRKFVRLPEDGGVATERLVPDDWTDMGELGTHPTPPAK